MLISMRVATWLSALVGTAVFLGVADFALRLPGWLRLFIGLAVVTVAVAWAFVRIGRSLRVDVGLTTLAQRLERLYPATAGRLASAVAFSTETSPAGEAPPRPAATGDSDRARQLSDQTTRNAEGILEREEIRRLLDASRTWRQIIILALVLTLTAGIAVAAPASASIAAQRWFQPLGDAAWPNRYAVQSLTDQQVAPNDVPLRLLAEVTQGDRPDLRTWAGFQFLASADDRPRAGRWQRALMTRQDQGDRAAGEYERLVELASGARAIAFYFEAGDDRTDVQVMELIQPPTLTELTATVQPPAYAADFIDPQQQYLLTPPRPSVTVEALAGSRIELEMRITGSFAPAADDDSPERTTQWVRQTLPGLIGEATDAEAMNITYRLLQADQGDTRLRVAWDLHQTHAFTFNLADAYGSRYEDQRLFRFEAREDRQPNASILTPGSDQQVLPTARVSLAAEAYDDVAVASMNLRASVGQEGDPTRLAHTDQPQPRTTLEAELDLAEMELVEGDEVALVAVAQDNYELNGQQHEAVESAVRWLRIISENELRRQLQAELADVRQRAIRARRTQQELREADADRRTASQQQEMAERLESVSRTIEGLEDRIEKNRLDSESMTQTLEQSQQLVEAARDRADEAADNLARAAGGEQDDPQTQEQLQQGREAQEAVATELDRLVQLLDQGRDAYEIQEQLTRLQREQEFLHDDVRELLPRTLGQSLEDLAEADLEALMEAGERQQELSEEAEELVERMRSTAAALSRNAERPEEQAVAEALREAAATADEQALQEQMEDAAEEVDENRLSQAQQSQEEAREVLREMQEQLGRVDELRQEILTRQLMELVEAIRELRDQQAAQLDRLADVDELAGLDEAMLQLRRNTIAVADDARQAGEETISVAAALEQAGDHMADAVRALRADDPNRATTEQAERNALRKLNEALALAEEASQQAQDEMSQQEREELVRAYRAALAQQEALRGQTHTLTEAEADARNRRWRADARDRGDEQAAVRDALAELQEKLSETIVYRSMHDQMDRWAASAAGSLREGDPSVRTVFNQDMVISTIEALIESLEAIDEPDEFAEGEQGGEGGGGGGQGGEPELIPDIAELRLLRTRQVLVHELTRRLDDSGIEDADMVEELSLQQVSLSETGAQLIQQLQQQMQADPDEAPAPQPEPEQPDNNLPGVDPEIQRLFDQQQEADEDEADADDAGEESSS